MAIANARHTKSPACPDLFLQLCRMIYDYDGRQVSINKAKIFVSNSKT